MINSLHSWQAWRGDMKGRKPMEVSKQFHVGHSTFSMMLPMNFNVHCQTCGAADGFTVSSLATEGSSWHHPWYFSFGDASVNLVTQCEMVKMVTWDHGSLDPDKANYCKFMWLSWYNKVESEEVSRFQEEDIDEIIQAYWELWYWRHSDHFQCSQGYWRWD